MKKIYTFLFIFSFILNVSAQQKFNRQAIFTDSSCSELKAGVKTEDIEKMKDTLLRNIALELKNGSYDSEFRIQSYRPYQSPKKSAERTKTLHTWGTLDNATGIYIASPDDDLIVMVGDSHNQRVELRIKNYDKGWVGESIVLMTGTNLIRKPGVGLCYICIFQDDYLPLHPETEEEINYIKSKSVNVHFATGEVNGYYDWSKNTGEDSQKLLNKAKHPYFDVKGKYAQLIWHTEDFKEAGTDLSEVIKKLDQLVGLEIDFSGFFKYGGAFSTRMFFMPSTSGKGNPNATLERVIFPRVYKDFFTTPSKDTFFKRLWGMAHEVGHCAQSNPGMRWGGMGEVGNNMFSIYVKTQLAGYENSNLLLEGYYEKARKLIIEANIAHADESILSRHMERLIPFWQLQLYFSEVKNYKDLYRDLYELYRTNPDVGTTWKNSGPLQLDFVRNVCHLSKTNMLDFFRAWGFLTPIDIVVNDYGKRILTITQEDIDDLITEIEAKAYPKPEKDVTKIQDDNFMYFR